MARVHDFSKPGEKTYEIATEIQLNSDATDKEADENLKKIGITEDQIDEAIEAAQAILNKYAIKAVVSEFAIQQISPEAKANCECGSRCVARTCEPYSFPCGQYTCSGHRLRCTRYACNPC